MLSVLFGGEALTAQGVVQGLSVAAFVALAIYGGCRDVASFTIPNWVSVGIVAAFAAAALAGAPAPSRLPGHAAAAVAVFAVGVVLFHFNVFGGGDVKLMSAAALWTGFGGLAELVLAVACFGGLLTLALLAGRALPRRLLTTHAGLARLVSGRHGVPYGIAIAAGVVTTFIVLPLLSGRAIS
ncbi:A24 family peptidase [Novispirillum sp. DQ9]|uniref:A24 family peptidase n=1 Tax=Novispirillum sp. DQ9 TaxID=3398612 RepID=UPI003C7A9785